MGKLFACERPGTFKREVNEYCETNWTSTRGDDGQLILLLMLVISSTCYQPSDCLGIMPSLSSYSFLRSKLSLIRLLCCAFFLSFTSSTLSIACTMTARMTLSRKKAPIMMRQIEKITASQEILESIRLYMIFAQPSSVMNQNTMTSPQNRFSNEAIP